MKANGSSPAPSPSSVWRVTSLWCASAVLYSLTGTPSHRKPENFKTFERSFMCVSSDGLGEPSRRGREIVLGVQTPSDEKDGIGAVPTDPVGHAGRVDAARRHRERRPHVPERVTQVVVDRDAGVLRKRKPTAHVGIDHRVAPRDPKD